MEKLGAVVVHVEDEQYWRNAVKEDLEEHLEFEDFVSLPNVNMVDKTIKQITKPIVMLMDLSYINGSRNSKGFDWIIDLFLQDHYSSVPMTVFVISGELNDLASSSLIDRGIPKDHIYGKIKWDDQVDTLIEIIKADVEEMISIQYQDKVDPFIRHIAEVHQMQNDETQTMEIVDKQLFIPMLIQIRVEDWNSKNYPNLELLGQMEDIIACRADLDTIEALRSDDAVISMEASRTSGNYDSAQTYTNNNLLSFLGADKVHKFEKGNQVIIAIIDTGINILHDTFLDDTGNSRIVGIWNQCDDTGPPPPDIFLKGNVPAFGTFYDNVAINEIRRTDSVPNSLQDVWSHGTQVASIAAGRECGDKNSGNYYSGGICPDAKILVVIPKSDVELFQPNTIGYQVSYQQALIFIKNFANYLKLPVVVNVSQGMNIGAHDGTSLVEASFNRFSGGGREGGYAIVKSAGNQGNEYIHAKFTLTQNHEDVLKWCVPQSTKSVEIDLWFSMNLHVEFRLDPPDKSDCDHSTSKSKNNWIQGNRLNHVQRMSNGNICTFQYTNYHKDNGDSRLHIAIDKGRSTQIKSGAWVLSLRCTKSGPNNIVHSWIERGKGKVQFINHTDPLGTISVPGTASHVICVGATLSPLLPARIAEYSALGPTRGNDKKPEICAPGSEIIVAVSDNYLGTTKNGGTSFAAPQVTGAIALLFSNWERHRGEVENWERLNLNQVRKALINSTKNQNSDWHEGLGYGVLDISSFLEEFKLKY